MRFPLSALLLTLISTSLFSAPAYDPLKIPEEKIISREMEIKDAKRDRTLPIRIYLPNTKSPAPVVLFSHGLGGSRDNNPYLGNQWASRGYVVVFVQHPGSDESVWKNTERLERMVAMKKAASVENFLLRTGDIPAVIDTLTTWNADKENPLHDRLDLKHIGMSGHSFGANTTQAVAGQSIAAGRASFLEPRISAAVMMSPCIPVLGDPAKAFEPIKLPCLLMTGTLDNSPISSSTAEDRLKVFPNLKNAPAWQIVFDKATHMSFGDRDLAGKSEDGNRYHQPILALTTAFWDAELKGDKQARAWLNGEGAKSVLAPEDKWEMNAMAKGQP